MFTHSSAAIVAIYGSALAANLSAVYRTKFVWKVVAMDVLDILCPKMYLCLYNGVLPIAVLGLLGL